MSDLQQDSTSLPLTSKSWERLPARMLTSRSEKWTAACVSILADFYCSYGKTRSALLSAGHSLTLPSPARSYDGALHRAFNKVVNYRFHQFAAVLNSKLSIIAQYFVFDHVWNRDCSCSQVAAATVPFLLQYTTALIAQLTTTRHWNPTKLSPDVSTWPPDCSLLTGWYWYSQTRTTSAHVEKHCSVDLTTQKALYSRNGTAVKWK